MGNLIDSILKYAKIGKENLELEKVDLNIVVKACVDSIDIPDHIKLNISKELPEVLGAKVLFEQIFQNLLTNSIKFMDKPNGIIEINCSGEGEFWHFTVKDNGPGIDEEHFERVFKIFQTLNPRSKIESTGIGLTIVKKIIGLYEGKIWIESKNGLGTTIHFKLHKIKGEL